MNKRLAEREREFIDGMGVDEETKRLLPKLNEIIADMQFRIDSAKARDKDTEAELLELDKVRIERAMHLLYLNNIEVFRKSEGIKHYLHGRGSTQSLRNIAYSWNSDPVKEES